MEELTLLDWLMGIGMTIFVGIFAGFLAFAVLMIGEILNYKEYKMNYKKPKIAIKQNGQWVDIDDYDIVQKVNGQWVEIPCYFDYKINKWINQETGAIFTPAMTIINEQQVRKGGGK